MDAVDHHAVIGDALGILIEGLTPFVGRVFADVLPPNMEWTELLRRKDMTSGRRVGTYQSRDLSLMLRAMTERLGELGFPFSQHLPRQAQNYAGELRDGACQVICVSDCGRLPLGHSGSRSGNWMAKVLSA